MEQGNPIWTAVYMRYHVEGTEECDSLSEALRFLSAGQEMGQCAPTQIRCPDGSVIKGEDLSEALFRLAEGAPGE